MIKHPSNIIGFKGSLEDFVEVYFNAPLGDRISFIDESAKDFKRQSEEDFERPSRKNPSENRSKLGCALLYVNEELITTSSFMRKINSEMPISKLDLFQSEIIKGLSLSELVFNIGNMRYDCVSEIYVGFQKRFQKEGDLKLSYDSNSEATKLYDISDSLKRVVKYINIAWKNCEPHMEKS